ncbi:MAG: hypothetical protein KatS3mg131_3632 [Candidatus Tectimicrobiota bacterium]|nr:MAG: hypothetical protein KatS3mg131_3632 [Candidatus Tectomicrobia bacterium]
MQERLERAVWQAYFDDFSKTHAGYMARIEILGRDYGDQEEAAWIPFSGISYDPHHDQLLITVGGMSSRYPVHLTHTIVRPVEIEVHPVPGEDLTSIRVAAADGTETLVTLRPEPQLPE